MNKFLEWIKALVKKEKTRSLVGNALLILGALLVVYALLTNFLSNRTTDTTSESQILSSFEFLEESAVESSEIESDSSQPESQPSLLYPTDRLFLTKGRQEYSDGEMTLRIPRLELDVPVMDGTDAESLKKGVGLYEYAQLPSEGNSNVSIAGHRDLYGCEFYKIDQITDGDFLYLTYNRTLYTYQYRQTEIVAADDWGPIYSKDFSCLTLTSCHPIGTSQKRIVVTAELISSAAV